jgi:hypothetical protein
MHKTIGKLRTAQICQERYVMVNISLIPLAETGINVSLAVDVVDG